VQVVREHRKHYDVVVVGGGLSGVCAAIAAARHGARTALVQARPVFGGNASSEMRMNITGAGCHHGKEDLNETGILMELLLENKWRNPYQSFSIWDSVQWEKVRFQQNLEAYLNTSLDSAEVRDGRITSIVCRQTTTESTYTISAEIFVDATGNGTLGFFAGAEYRIGGEARGEFGEPHAPEQPTPFTLGNTLMFIAEDMGEPVPFRKPSWAYTFTEEDLKFRGHGDMQLDHGENGIKEQYNADSGYWWIEVGGTSKDIIADHEKITDELYRCVYGVWDHLKNCGDHGAANFALSWVGAVPGVRESRRLVGDYLLTEMDVSGNRVFEDAVAYGGWPMDDHYPEGIFHKGPPTRYLNFPGAYTIPYRCFYSRNVANLMMAGRDISTTRVALGSTRVMGTCAVGGQAVGTAAALAIRAGCTPREVARRMGELQQLLLKDDCYLPGYRNADPLDLARTATVSASSHLRGREPRNVTNGVARRVGADENCWESDGLKGNGETIALKLPAPARLRELRLTFDPNLTREIVPSITKRVRDRQVKGMPVELVKDYAVRVALGGKTTYFADISENYQRLNVLPLPQGVSGDTVEVTVSKTHGHPNARIFEIRAY